MSYKNIPSLLTDVEIVKRADTREIDGSTQSLELFQKSPSRDQSQRSYISNAFDGDFHHIVLDLSLNLTSAVLVEDQAGDVQPSTIVNELKDGFVLIETNGGRTERIHQPISDYMNFAQTRGMIGVTDDGDTAPSVLSREMIVLEATGPRPIPDLFVLQKNESFTFELKFNDGTNFPAAADYSPGRLAITAQMTLAQVNSQQLAKYEHKFQSANN